MTVTTQLWPPINPPMDRRVWNARTARKVPGVGRALSIYSLIAAMPMDAYRGPDPLPRPRLLDQPDPTELGGAPLFIRDHVQDYLFHGNAMHLVTARDQYGWPLAVRYFPAEHWSIICDPLGGNRQYYLFGQEVPTGDVIHCRRGTDPWLPARGIGVLEEYLGTFDRAAKQEKYEDDALTHGGVPTVAVIAPQKNLTQEQADAAGEAWDEMFDERRPGIFPSGTQVLPLSWSPSDQQLTDARKLTLTDIANAFNLDSYWLGAPTTSHTYRTAGPMFVQLNRVSLLSVYTDLQEVWGRGWLPRGQVLRFDQKAITADDLAASMPWLVQAVTSGIWSDAEARVYLGMAPDAPGRRLPGPVTTGEGPVDDPQEIGAGPNDQSGDQQGSDQEGE